MNQAENVLHVIDIYLDTEDTLRIVDHVELTTTVEPKRYNFDEVDYDHETRNIVWRFKDDSAIKFTRKTKTIEVI